MFAARPLLLVAVLAAACPGQSVDRLDRASSPDGSAAMPDSGAAPTADSAGARGSDARATVDSASPARDTAAPVACGSIKPASYTWPVPAVHSICQKFGNPISYQTCGFHTGIDVCGQNGLVLAAVADARVIYVGPLWYNTATTGRGPYAVVLQHAPGFFSTYSHNRAAMVKAGECVKLGQKIAEMGSLGYSSGPHLHFEMLEGASFTGSWQSPFVDACKRYVDPLKYIKP